MNTGNIGARRIGAARLPGLRQPIASIKHQGKKPCTLLFNNPLSCAKSRTSRIALPHRRLVTAKAGNNGFSAASGGGGPTSSMSLSSIDDDKLLVPTLADQGKWSFSRFLADIKQASQQDTAASMLFHYMLFVASLLFVALYVWGTYAPVVRGSGRWHLELALCMFFGVEYTYRLVVSHPSWGSKLRMVTSLRNVLDLLAFAPPLVEAAMQQFAPAFTLGLDLRWIKLLRSMRVLRIGLLGSELHSLHLSTQSGGWLTAGANFRLFQLATSVLMLLFMTTSVIQIVEQIPFHKAMYFVATTLTTVGYGDVVPQTVLGRACVLAMIAVGVVLIPVQAAQFYSEVTARRVVRGMIPDWKSKPFVLLSTRLTEVRAFSDFFSEFTQALGQHPAAKLPRNTALVVLCNRPSYEFTAFQELHERHVTLVEGSAVAGQDLVTVHAERARAIMLLADRFTTDPDQEDLGILFQVWACKSFTKTVPLYVQTIRESTVRQIAPFLDLEQDVIVSMEQTRFRLLALSAVCPGSSTLMCNLLKSSSVRKLKSQEPKLAGRRWLRAYVNGCDYRFLEVPVLKHFAGEMFVEVAEWLYWASGFVLIGLITDEGAVRLNPAKSRLELGTTLIVIGTSTKDVIKAMKVQYSPVSDRLKEQLRRRSNSNGSGSTQQQPQEATRASRTTAREQDSPARWEEELVECEGDTTTSVGANPASTIETGTNTASSPSAGTTAERYSSGSIEGENCVSFEDVEKLDNPQGVKNFIQQQLKINEADLLLDGSNTATVSAARSGSSSDEKNNAGSSSNGASDTHNGTTAVQSSDSTTASASDTSSSIADSSSPYSNHFILCGASRSVVPFMEHLRKAAPTREAPIVVLAVHPPEDLALANERYGPVYFVKGQPSDSASLRAAGAATAKALVYLARSSRPVKTAQATGSPLQLERSTREAVLADADALLACYGVGEESGAELTHTVVELLFTTSICFLQPGLLLKGVNVIYDENAVDAGQPRKSWQMRAWQQREAVAEGLAEWQANPYFAAGRVTVPALMDTFATQCFFNQGMLAELLAELCGEFEKGSGGDDGGALLQQIALPRGLWGRTYGDCFMTLPVTNNLISLGLYRKKSENAATRLSYVVANPPWNEVLEPTDRVFVLRDRSSGNISD